MITDRIFLSGRFDVGTEIEKAWLKRTGCKYRCFTFANLDPKSKYYNRRVVASLDCCEKKNINIMLDSGAATLHNIQRALTSRNKHAMKKHDLDTTEIANDIFARYVTYIKENKHKWTFFITLDFEKKQPIIFAMQKRFEKEGLHPAPVFHGDSSVDWINKYHDRGHKLLCVSSITSRRRGNRKAFGYYLDAVFDRTTKLGMDVHGLAVTSLSLMRQYPWWSVDSASWTKTASFGSILLPNLEKNTIANLHVSVRSTGASSSYGKMTRRNQQHIREYVSALDFDIKDLRNDVKARHDFNGYIFSNINKLGIDFDKVENNKWKTLL